LGIGGITGALVSVLVQAYFLRKERERQYFRELVITPDFLRFIGAMESLGKALGKITNQTTIQEARTIIADTSKAYEERYRRLVSAGGTFFIPDQVREGLDGITNALDDWGRFAAQGEKDELPGDALFYSIGAMASLGTELYNARAFLKKHLGIPE
jgi:soluble cytochrome b562